MRLGFFLLFLFISTFVHAEYQNTHDFSNYSEHFSEKEINGEIILIKSVFPKELVDALDSISSIQLGRDILESAKKLKQQFTFVEVSKLTDPDYAVAFRVGFDGLGPNSIHYTKDLEGWKVKVLLEKPEKKGEQISSATLGSLIAHELGHTEIGLNSLGKSYELISDYSEVIISEKVAVNYFENIYRAEYKMPLRTTYFKFEDMVKVFFTKLFI